MKSGGGVLCMSALQVVAALCLLGIYEAFKTHYLKDHIALAEKDRESSVLDSEVEQTHDNRGPCAERNFAYRTPMDYVFYLSILCNVFSVLGAAGILQQQKELVVAYFTYNAIQMVTVFHYFVDICADIGIRFRGQSASLDGYEQAAATFLFFILCLSASSALFSARAMNEMKLKQREEYHRMAVFSSDALQFEPDV